MQSFYRLQHHFNRMLLRTVVLLLLCTSVGMCATLVSYQTVQMEQGVPVVDIAAASEDVSAPEAALDQELGSDPPADTHGVDNSTAGEAGVDLSAADGAGTDKDRPSGDASMLQAVTPEAATSKQPPPVKEGNDIRPVQTKSPSRPLAEDESGWSLSSIRKRFQAVHGYFDSLVELAGGQNGVCQYRCRHGKSHSLESSLGCWCGRKNAFRGQFVGYWLNDTVLIVKTVISPGISTVIQSVCFQSDGSILSVNLHSRTEVYSGYVN